MRCQQRRAPTSGRTPSEATHASEVVHDTRLHRSILAASPIPPTPPSRSPSSTTADRLEIHVHGEVDIAAHDLLADQLSAVDLSGIAAVDLRLAELDFCDSYGVRQLLDFADAARRAGCTVGLHDARPQLARLIALIDTSTAA